MKIISLLLSNEIKSTLYILLLNQLVTVQIWHYICKILPFFSGKHKDIFTGNIQI